MLISLPPLFTIIKEIHLNLSIHTPSGIAFRYFVVDQFTISFELVRIGLQPDIVIDIQEKQEKIDTSGLFFNTYTTFNIVDEAKFTFLENRDISRMSQALWLEEKLDRIGLFDKTNRESS